MDSNFAYYIFILIAIIVGIVIIKKVTSCLFRLVTLAVLIALLAYVYFSYIQ